MPYDEATAERVRRALKGKRGFVEKKMFGGVGFLLRGNMCVGVWREFLILRLGIDAAEAALREPSVRKFDITGKPMSGWVMVGHDDLPDEPSLAAWLHRAIAFVSTLPAK